jgi:putative oxidoreductase
MTMLSLAIALATRMLLVALFLPFSALDKIFNFGGARSQAGQLAPAALTTPLVLAGLFVEIVMSLGVLTGVADRLAAGVLALYCCLTALGWKQFWRPGDFFKPGESAARNLFWDFWKNLALAGGFLLITFGTGASDLRTFFDNPLSSTHPYSVTGGDHE